jgi:hypothetical protein
MRRKIVLFIVLFTTVALLIFLYKNYGRRKANEYAKHLGVRRPLPIYELDIGDDVQIERIIRQTPINLVMLIKWGDNEKAYVSIDHWMTKAHDTILIHAVDKKKTIRMQE